ncbi:hypothetical protein NQ318_010746 [Aromia moschata]|uniref:Uncharacterized protein n=1 Tax=Aromia moschata TaxID=1265417 RepID=A0AAV8YXR5_9CUCU|nr:hypothetical protein NQ318_010746 [Aromia moschata]
MSASTEYNCDYWNMNNQYSYNAYTSRSNQFFNEPPKADDYALSHSSLMKENPPGMYQGHLSSSLMNDAQPYSVKEEPTYNTCRFNINQTYSDLDIRTDNSISPPPMNHNFTHNLNQFDSCRQAYKSLVATMSPNDSSPSSTLNDSDDSPSKVKSDDSPALRALLSKPGGKKIAYDYSNLHKIPTHDAYQKACFDNSGYNNASKFQKDGEYNCDDQDLAQFNKDKRMTEEQSGEDNLAAMQSNFYPWMKSSYACSHPLLNICLFGVFPPLCILSTQNPILTGSPLNIIPPSCFGAPKTLLSFSGPPLHYSLRLLDIIIIPSDVPCPAPFIGGIRSMRDQRLLFSLSDGFISDSFLRD